MSTNDPHHADGNGRVAQSDHPASPGRISTDASPRTGRLLAWAGGVLVLLLAIGFGIAYAVHRRTENAADRQASAASDRKVSVEVVTVQPTPSSYPLALPGQTAGWYQSTIYARVDGYIENWSADIGDRIKQGQVLATIDTPELDQQLNAAKAKAAASNAQVDVTLSDESIAKLTYDRWRDSPKGVVSDQEREEKQAQYTAAVAHLAEAKAQAQLDEAEVGRYAALEDFRKVTAPYDGVVTARKVDIGDLVSMGSGANTSPLYSVAQSNLIRVFVDVPQKAGAEMVVGLTAHVSSDQFPGRTFSGKIARSTMSIDPQTRTERVEVDVPNADLSLVPGMYVQVTFELNQHGLLEVPAAAILPRASGLQVAVVDGDGKIKFRDVTVAKDDGDVVELATGVNPGDRVALNLSSAVVPGEQVDATESDQGHPIPPPPQVAPTAPTEQTNGPQPKMPAAGQTPPVPDTGINPPAPAVAPIPVPGPSGPGRTIEPAPTPANNAPLNQPAGGTGNTAGSD